LRRGHRAASRRRRAAAGAGLPRPTGLAGTLDPHLVLLPIGAQGRQPAVGVEVVREDAVDDGLAAAVEVDRDRAHVGALVAGRIRLAHAEGDRGLAHDFVPELPDGVLAAMALALGVE